MSKVSRYIDKSNDFYAQQKLARDKFHESCPKFAPFHVEGLHNGMPHTTVFDVTHSGNMRVRGTVEQFTPERALDIADWIYDMFGPDDADDDGALGHHILDGGDANDPTA